MALIAWQGEPSLSIENRQSDMTASLDASEV